MDLSHKFYTKFLLQNIYRRYTLNFSFSYVWKCPTSSILVPLFSENFSEKHLDCGVGEGFFPATSLEGCSRQVQAAHHTTLLDINLHCLNTASENILLAAPETHVDCVVADMTAPLPPFPNKFQSISLFNHLHCLPGGKSKYDTISKLKSLLAENGILTGCTVLGEYHFSGWLAWIHKKVFNWAGIFNNVNDNQDDIERKLREEFDQVDTWVVGAMLLFKAQKPKMG